MNLIYISYGILGLALGILFASACTAIARNENTADKITALAIIGGAFIEFIVLVSVFLIIRAK